MRIPLEPGRKLAFVLAGGGSAEAAQVGMLGSWPSFATFEAKPFQLLIDERIEANEGFSILLALSNDVIQEISQRFERPLARH